VHAVVLPDSGQPVVAQGVEDADGVCLVGESGNLGFGGPAEGGYLVVGGEVSSGDLAAEDQRDDAAGQFL
jgi:hypothetical protein